MSNSISYNGGTNQLQWIVSEAGSYAPTIVGTVIPVSSWSIGGFPALPLGIAFDTNTGTFSGTALRSTSALNIIVTANFENNSSEQRIVEITVTLPTYFAMQINNPYLGYDVYLPYLLTGSYSGFIDWGDASNNEVNSYATRKHTYASTGVYIVKISQGGVIDGWRTGGIDPFYIVDMLSFGTSFAFGPDNGLYFNGCQSLIHVAPLATIVQTQTNLQSMFGSCPLLATIDDIANWNVGNVVNMLGMFTGASVFNSNISGWDVRNVTTMRSMFLNAQLFNQPIGSWEISKVTDLSYMFYGCTAFNQPLGAWFNDIGLNLQDAAEFISNNNNAYSATNLDDLYNNWYTVIPINTGGTGTLTLTAYYTSASAANRAIMFGNWNARGWFIYDLGMIDLVYNNGAPFVFTAYVNIQNVGLPVVVNTSLPPAPVFVLTPTAPATGLPAGLTFVSATGQIVGTPIEEVTTPLAFSASVTDTYGNVITTTFSLTVNTKFVAYLQIQTAGQVVKLPYYDVGSTYGGTIDWGDGSLPVQNTYANGSNGHSYMATTAPGSYITLVIDGTINGWNNSGFQDMSAFYSIPTFGPTFMFGNDVGQYFFFFENLVSTGPLKDIIVHQTNLFLMYLYCFNFVGTFELDGVTPEMNLWTMSNVSSTEGMFAYAYEFNQDISSWNVNNIVVMSHMFQYALAFNRPLGAWATALSNNLSSASIFIDNNVYTSANLDDIYNNWYAVTPNTSAGSHSLYISAKYTVNSVINRANMVANWQNWTITDLGGEPGMAYFQAPFNFSIATTVNSLLTAPTLTGGPFDEDSFLISVIDSTTMQPVSLPAGLTFNTADGTFSGTPLEMTTVALTCTVTAVNTDTQQVVSSLPFALSVTATNVFTAILQIPSDNYTFRLPYYDGGTYGGGLILWGDGTSSPNTYANGGVTGHMYDLQTLPGEYVTLYIGGTINGWNNSVSLDMSAFYSIPNFGSNFAFGNDGGYYFIYFTNLVSTGPLKDIIVSQNVLYLMFFDCQHFVGTFKADGVTPEMPEWDTSGVVDMVGMFYDAYEFNQPIGSWDVSNVGVLNFMFYGANSFNKSLAGWASNLSTNLQDAVFFIQNSVYSSTNLDALYNSWYTVTPNTSAGDHYLSISAYYTVNSVVNRANMVATWQNWTITDLGFIPGLAYFQAPFIFTISEAVDSPTTAPTVLGGPYTYTLSLVDSLGSPASFPLGLTFNSNDGTFSGTPFRATSGTLTGTVTAFNDGTNVTVVSPPFTLTVVRPTYFAIQVYVNNDGDVVTLPYLPGGTYTGQIDWGDSTQLNDNDYITVGLNGHAYTVAGYYIIKVNGEITGWNASFVTFFDNPYAYLPLIDLLSFGDNFEFGPDENSLFLSCMNLAHIPPMNALLVNKTSFFLMFALCFNLTNVEDISDWNTSAVLNMVYLFYGAISFNQDIHDWDVQNVQSMYAMFTSAYAFNQPLGAWNISGIVNSYPDYPSFNFFLTSFTNPPFLPTEEPMQFMPSNVDNLYSNWSNKQGLQSDLILDISANYSLAGGAAGKAVLQNTYGWTINDNGVLFVSYPDSPYNLLINVPLPQPITPLINASGVYDLFSISPANLTAQTGLTFDPSAGTIDGTPTIFVYPALTFTVTAYATNDHAAIATTTFALSVIKPFQLIATISLPANQAYTVTLPYLANGIYDEEGFIVWGDATPPVSNTYANRSHVYDLSQQVVPMQGGSFTLFITGDQTDGWNFSDGTGDLSLMTNLSYLGPGFSFGSPDVGYFFTGCATLGTITAGAALNNYIIGRTSFSHAFAGCHMLTTISGIASWNINTITDMSYMFQDAWAFNMSLVAWGSNTEFVTDMSHMFENAFVFQQNITSWKTTRVTTMNAMFHNAFNFNQNISIWSIPQVNDLTNFLVGASKFSIYHLDQLYKNWYAQAPALQSGVPFGASQKHSEGSLGALQGLRLAPYNWVINDGGLWTVSYPNSHPFTFYEGIPISAFPQSNVPLEDITDYAVSVGTPLPINIGLLPLTGQITGMPGSTQAQRITPYTLYAYADPLIGGTSSFATINIEITIFNQTYFSAQYVSPVNNWVLKLPYLSSGTYNGFINWGDGSESDNTLATAQHTYAAAGTYTVVVNGLINGWNTTYGEGNSNSKNYLKSVDTIGNTFAFGAGPSADIGGYFADCPLLQTITANLTVPVGLQTNLAYMFAGCTALTNVANIATWVIWQVTTMEGMFFNASLFNQDLSSWIPVQVTTFAKFLSGATSFYASYLDALYNGWSQNDLTQFCVFDASANYSTTGVAGRNQLTRITSPGFGWTIHDNGILAITYPPNGYSFGLTEINTTLALPITNPPNGYNQFIFTPATPPPGSGLAFNTTTGQVSKVAVATDGLPETTFTVLANLVNGDTTVSASGSFTVLIRDLTYNPTNVTLYAGVGQQVFIQPTIIGETDYLLFNLVPALSPKSGLEFDPYTAIITGQPKQLQAKTSYTVIATLTNLTTETYTNVLTIEIVTRPALRYNPDTYQLLIESPISPAITPTLKQVPPVLAAGGYSITPAATLPADVVFDTTTGIISGTPLSATTPAGIQYTVFFTTLPAVRTTLLLTFVYFIYPSPPILDYMSPMVPISIITNEPLSALSNFTVTPPLPSGLVLNAQTGTISGTPTRIYNEAQYAVTATVQITTPVPATAPLAPAPAFLATGHFRPLTTITVVSTYIVTLRVCNLRIGGCPPRVIPTPNAAFGGNTNILTVDNTNAFRYGVLVRSGQGRNIYISNPLASVPPVPPRNSF